ncbi:hypothetical protein [Haliovirga abyssi]|uniref:Uncharacterized protein n=1 Tax=Haliovirga abyssi TaxID=2996794 RepID=A0AAU9DZR4_9FUSO|nr:hypothetical protein [Haliovirga abyssi]BDU49500.1 hypothetical protein HLVA_00690 [Haliovirga abyssi]
MLGVIRNDKSYVLIPFKDINKDGKYELKEIIKYRDIIKKARKAKIDFDKRINWSRKNKKIEGIINFNNPRYPAIFQFIAVDSNDGIINVNMKE